MTNPDDLAIQILQWLGAPAAIIVVVNAVFFAASWAAFANTGRRAVGVVVSSVALVSVPRLVLLIVFESALAAWLFAAIRMGQFFATSDRSNGSTYTGLEVMRAASSFAGEWTKAAQVAIAGVGGLILLIGLAASTGSRPAIAGVRIVLWIGIVVGTLIALGNVVIGCAATTAVSGGLAIVYGTWVILGAGIAMWSFLTLEISNGLAVDARRVR